MEIYVDALILESQLHGGIPRIFYEILPRMCNIESSLQVNLLIFGITLGSHPQHPRITHNVFQGPEFMRTYRGRGQKYLEKARRLITRMGISETQHKIWHSTYYSSLPFWKGPKVVTVYDLIYEKYPSLFIDADKVISDKRREVTQADAVICISHSTKKDLHRYYKVADEKVHVIYPGFNPVFSSERIKIGGNQPFFLYVGSRAGYKGFRDLLKALVYGNIQSEIKLVVVGQPFSPEEKQAIEELKLKDRITLRTNIPDVELRFLYQHAIAFIYPSLAEGFGIPLLEAMACECPIVASHIPSTIEVAKDIPIYFEPGSHESLHTALDQALREGLRASKGIEGLDRVNDFSWDKTAQATLDVYHSLL